MSKRFLIFGGAGFIGSHITKELLSKGNEVFIYDNFSNFIPPQEGHYPFYLKKRLKDIQNNVQIIRGDIRDKDLLLKTIKEINPEIVINLVAIPLANASTVYFEDAMEINLNGHIKLLESLREAPSLERIVYTSSSFVYGNFNYDPADEKHPTSPIDIYGSTKLSCEMLTKNYAQRYGLDYTIIRPSAVYGPTDSNLRVSQIFVQNAFMKKPLVLCNGGKNKVDFSYVTDTAHGFVLASLSDKGKNETFNITAGAGRSPEEFANILDKLLPGFVKTEIKTNNIKRPDRGGLDISKAKNLLGYKPEYQLEDGLKTYIEYIKSTKLFDNPTKEMLEAKEDTSV